MNSLSWLIYLASVTDELQHSWEGIFIIMLFVTIMMSGLFLLIVLIHEEEFPFYKTYMKWAAPLLIVSFLFSNLLPKKEMIMLIAASEFGDRIMTQQKIGERIVDPSINLLQEWIKKQTEELTAKKK